MYNVNDRIRLICIFVYTVDLLSVILYVDLCHRKALFVKDPCYLRLHVYTQ